MSMRNAKSFSSYYQDSVLAQSKLDFAQNINRSVNQNSDFCGDNSIPQRMDNAKRECEMSRNKMVRLSQLMFGRAVNVEQKKEYKFGTNFYDNDQWLDRSHLAGELQESKVQASPKKHRQPPPTSRFKFQHSESDDTRFDKEVVKPVMSLPDINQIQTDQFLLNCQDREFFPQIVDLIESNRRQVLSTKNSQRTTVKKKPTIDQFLSTKVTPKNQDSCIVLTQELASLNINIRNNMSIYRNALPTSRNIPVDFSRISFLSMLELSTGMYDLATLILHVQTATQNSKNYKLLEVDNGIQAKVQELKQQIQRAKRLKNNNKLKSYEDNQTQTQVIVAKDNTMAIENREDNVLIAKIDNLFAIKKELFKTRDPRDIIQYINPQIHQRLFELLLEIVCGEQFLRMPELMRMDAGQVEAKVLHLLYSNLFHLQGKQTKSGNNKIHLIKVYSNHKATLQLEESGLNITRNPQYPAPVSRTPNKKLPKKQTTQNRANKLSVTPVKKAEPRPFPFPRVSNVSPFRMSATKGSFSKSPLRPSIPARRPPK